MQQSKTTYLYHLSKGIGDEVPVSEEKGYVASFEPVSGKLIISMWVRMDIHNTGVNVFTLFGESTESGKRNDACRDAGNIDGAKIPVIKLDTEGAYFYAYDGKKKQKLSHFNSDDWYSVYVQVNTHTGRYSL